MSHAPDNAGRVTDLVDVLGDTLVKGFFVFSDGDLRERFGADLWIALLLFAEPLREAAIATYDDGAIELLDHRVEGLERTAKWRDVHGIGMPVLLDQALGHLCSFLSAAIV